MLVLISNNRNSEFVFSQICKMENIDFIIIEKVTSLFHYSDEIRKGFTVIDWNNLPFKDLIEDLKSCGELFANSILVGENSCFDCVKTIEEALVIAKYQFEHNKGILKYSERDVQSIIKDTLDKYDFKENYAGYKYLKSICEYQSYNKNMIFNYKHATTEISQLYGVESVLLIERNLRYLVEVNTNKEILDIRGDKTSVPVKAVIAFLLSKIDENLQRLNA